MTITLVRPVCDYEPTPVPEHLVAGLDVMHVPTQLREHACAMLIGLPAPSPWLVMGEWYPTPAPRTLLARRSVSGTVRYGTLLPPTVPPTTPATPRLLACTRCQDSRHDADVAPGGVSLGAQCVFPDCRGVYAAAR